MVWNCLCWDGNNLSEKRWRPLINPFQKSVNRIHLVIKKSSKTCGAYVFRTVSLFHDGMNKIISLHRIYSAEVFSLQFTAWRVKCEDGRCDFNARHVQSSLKHKGNRSNFFCFFELEKREEENRRLYSKRRETSGI